MYIYTYHITPSSDSKSFRNYLLHNSNSPSYFQKEIFAAVARILFLSDSGMTRFSIECVRSIRLRKYYSMLYNLRSPSSLWKDLFVDCRPNVFLIRFWDCLLSSSTIAKTSAVAIPGGFSLPKVNNNSVFVSSASKYVLISCFLIRCWGYPKLIYVV